MKSQVENKSDEIPIVMVQEPPVSQIGNKTNKDFKKPLMMSSDSSS
jgi:hypothetical protein